MNWWALAGAMLVGTALSNYMQLSRIEGFLLVAGIWLLANGKELATWEREGKS